jgi:copper chaperone CopZ
MKKSLLKILVAIVIMLSTTINAQIKNTKVVEVKISGNCGMCKKTIEKAGNLKNIALVEWNKETNMATLTYDEAKTNKDEILKRVATAGYDSEFFKAKDEDYNNLHGCCQYDRE